MRGRSGRHHARRPVRAWLSRGLAAVGGLGLIVAVVPGPGQVDAQEASTDRPDVFRSSAAALVAEASLDRDALLPISDVFRFMAVEGRGTYESSNQTAQASLIYPGNGLISGPNLVCGTFGGQFPPEFAPLLEACSAYRFPLSVRADSLQPDAASEGATRLGAAGDPVSGEAARAVAHAATDASTTDAALSSLQILGLPAIGDLGALPLDGVPALDDSVLRIDGATSRTNQRIDDTGTLVVDATSTVTGIRLLGGLIDIGSIRSVASITDDGRGAQSQHAELEIAGVTVAGIPARITGDGLEVGSPTGGVGPLVDQATQLLNELVAALAIEVTVLDVSEGVDDAGSAFARAGGLLVEFATSLDGVPILPGPIGDVDLNGLYRGSITLGQAGATGQAAHIDVPDFVPAPDFVDGAVPPGPIGSSGAAPSAPDLPSASPGSGSAAGPPAATPGGLVRILTWDQPIEGRLRLVYLSFALLALAACVAPRFAFPARLPGARP